VKRRARRCLGVDIGSTSLKVAELSQDRSGVIIQRLVEAPLDVTPDTPADARWAAVVQTLRDLLRENKIGARQAVYALPGHAVFVRRVRLPRTSEERLERIIRFEARQQIPFPLEQTLLQYQVSSTDVPDEVEVLLVAIKREIVDNYMHLIRRLGLRPIQLGVSSFALFNYHMFDAGVKPEKFKLEDVVPATVEPVPVAKPEAKAEGQKPAKTGGFMAGLKKFMSGKKKKAPVAEEPATEELSSRELVPVGPAEEVKAFVNVGASTMDLAIGRTGGARVIGFARSIPVAGHQITRMIQERCGCESFAEAERVKREQTQVTPSPSGERYNEQACRAVMPIVDRMVAEIRRSLDFYISQPDGMAVDRLILSGGQTGLPNLSSYVEERLSIPVETAREMHNSACRFNVQPGMEITNFLVSIGLALQGLGEGCITIDFLPEQMKGWIEFKRKNIQLMVQAGFLAALLFIASQIGNRMIFLWNSKAREMKLTTDGAGRIREEFDKAQGRRGKIGLIISFMRIGCGMSSDYGLDRDYFFRVLSLIQTVRPYDVFFGDINMGPNGELTIEGYAEQQKSAALMTQAFSMLPEVSKAALTRLPTQVRDPSGAGRGMIYSFQLTAELKGKRSKIVPPALPQGPGGGVYWGPRPPVGRPGAAPGPGGLTSEENRS
jgi:Tfp pilus assembly PilM family ATPase